MTQQTLTLSMQILALCGGAFALYGVYYLCIALFGFKKRQDAPAEAPTTRFAVVIAARNEENVIGQLVDSLHHQNYPREQYDILVAPNNCTDKTREVALAHGATIFDPVGKIASKGEVLTQVVAQLLSEKKYDAMCVFDADNLVHPDFLQKMNDARQSGVRVAQGFRDSKNPADTAVSTCYSVCYWMLNRFYNGGREALSLSGLVNGSGFMVTTSLLAQLGGWHTRTMTEDYEFTAQCVLQGEKVHYVQNAVIYDEQPLTFMQSWKQRRRWSSGSVQGMEEYLPALLQNAIAERNGQSLDLALTFMMPLTQLVSSIMGAATLALGGYSLLHYRLIPFTNALMFVGLALFGAFLVCCLLATFVVMLNRGGSIRGTGPGILCFALFLLSWLPIGLISLFKKTKTWDPIAHSHAVSMGELSAHR